MRKNALVKISGNLLESRGVLECLKTMADECHLVVCIGGGTQINAAFEKRGLPIKFGPHGRETATLEERQLARDVLEVNQALVQDQFHKLGIRAEVVIPVENVGSVLCHMNGDLFVFKGLIDFDRICVFTEVHNVAKKREFYKDYPKIEIFGW